MGGPWHGYTDLLREAGAITARAAEHVKARLDEENAKAERRWVAAAAREREERAALPWWKKLVP